MLSEHFSKGGTSNATVVETEDANGASNTTDVTIREAFVDDDVITEFRRDKKQQVESDKPKVVDLILPGFDGEWAGEDFKVLVQLFSKISQHFEQSHQNAKNAASDDNRNRRQEPTDHFIT